MVSGRASGWPWLGPLDGRYDIYYYIMAAPARRKKKRAARPRFEASFDDDDDDDDDDTTTRREDKRGSGFATGAESASSVAKRFCTGLNNECINWM